MKATIFLEDTPDGPVLLQANFFGGETSSPAHQAARDLITYFEHQGEQAAEPVERTLELPEKNLDRHLAQQPPLIWTRPSRDEIASN